MSQATTAVVQSTPHRQTDKHTQLFDVLLPAPGSHPRQLRLVRVGAHMDVDPVSGVVVRIDLHVLKGA